MKPGDVVQHGDDQVVRCRLSQSPLDASGTEPKWNLILPAGQYYGPTLAAHGGSFTYDQPFFETLIANWKANGSFRIPMRWGHEHKKNDDPAKAKELDRKAANVVDLRATDAGLEGLCAWNDSGRKDVVSGEFDGLSAEYQLRHLNRLTNTIGGPLLTGVALTNDPFFNLMPPVAASAGAESTDPNPHQEQLMDKEQLKTWALSLGLSADATAAQCISASNAKLAAAEAKSVTASAVPAEVITAAVKPVQEQVVLLEAKLKASEEKSLERDVDQAIEVGKRGDGKLGRAITADLRTFIMATAKSSGLEEAVKLINALPAHVPMKALGVDSKQEEGTVSASAANEKLNAIANELQAKGETAPMVAAMKLHPELAKAAQSLSTTTVKQN